MGDAVTRFKVGDEVYFMNGGMGGDDQGNYAELTTIHQDYAALKPESLSMEEASTVPLAWLTAWEALVDRIHLQAGETVLIHGGAGGVGYIAVQIAKHLGATVYTTVSSAEKADFARSLGADYCINYKVEDFAAVVMELTNGQGVDKVFDVIGGPVFAASFAATRIYGHVVTLAEISINQKQAELAKLRNLTLSYELVLSPMHFKMHQARINQREMLVKAAKLIDAGKIKIYVGHVFPLKEIGQAHEIIETGHSMGKNAIKII